MKTIEIIEKAIRDGYTNNSEIMMCAMNLGYFAIDSLESLKNANEFVQGQVLKSLRELYQNSPY